MRVRRRSSDRTKEEKKKGRVKTADGPCHQEAVMVGLCAAFAGWIMGKGMGIRLLDGLPWM